MLVRTWGISVISLSLLVSPALAQTCRGDCQPGSISGPYTAAQVAEFSTTSPFPVCHSSSCTSGTWKGDQIEGIDAQQNIGGQYQFYDNENPDIDDNIAVGPTVSGQNAQVLEWVNAQFVQAFDKVTGQPIFTSTTGGTTAIPVNVGVLWSARTQPECADNASGNVQVIFDRLDNAFVISRRISYTNGNGIHEYAWCVAASSQTDLSNPGIQWYAYEYQMNTVIPCVPSSNNCTTGSYYYYFPDWPRVGTWSNGFYITFDLQDPTAGYTESGFEACQLDRTDIVQGNPSNPISCYTYTIPAADRPSLIHSVDVADIDSATPPPSGEPEYFLSIVNPSNGQQGGNGLSVCTSQTTPCTSNQLALFTWGSNGLTGPTLMTVNSYTPGCYNTSSKGQEVNTYCVPEPSTSANDIGAYGKASCGNSTTPCLDSLGDRMANRLTYNNLSSSNGGPNGGYLTASHVVMESTSNQRTGIRYYILSVSSGKASIAVNSGGGSPPDLQDPDGIAFLLMPSAALDEDGNMAFTFTSSGPYCASCQYQRHPAIYVDLLPWKASKPITQVLIVRGAADQQNTDRFGEYAATVLDSTDNVTFYSVGEYYMTNENGESNCGVPSSDCYTWQTRIFRGQGDEYHGAIAKK
jgi:hypothetical protein